MRGVTVKQDRERGAAAVLVAILTVVLLGFSALAVDVGLLYSEKAQLQNGADAGALGIAQACAKDTASASCTSPVSFAKGMADNNSLDNFSNVQSVNLELGTRTVTVTADPIEAGRTDNRVSLYFASIFGISASSVVATSSVKWGSPRRGITPFPLTISVCQVKGMVDSGTQLIRSHTAKNQNKVNAGCKEGPAGKDTPGGFGWLAQDPGSCSATIDLGTESGSSTVSDADTNTGNDTPTGCETTLQDWAAEIEAGRDVIIVLPIFRDVTGTGAGTSYDVVDFAAFKVEGWKFSGPHALPWTFRNRPEWAGANACSGDCRGIIGSFIKYVSLSSSYEELGPVSPYGATVVKLTN